MRFRLLVSTMIGKTHLKLGHNITIHLEGELILNTIFFRYTLHRNVCDKLGKNSQHNIFHRYCKIANN